MALEIHAACMDPGCKKCNPRWSPTAGRTQHLEQQEGEPYKTADKLLKFCKRSLKQDNLNDQYKDRLRKTVSALKEIKAHW